MRETEDFQARTWDAAHNNVWAVLYLSNELQNSALAAFFWAKYQDAQQYNFLVEAKCQEVRKV